MIILSTTPSLMVDRPSGLYGGNQESHVLLAEYKQAKTNISSIAFAGFIFMIALSPFWYRRNLEVSSKDLLVFCLSLISVGMVLLISFFPEVIIGQRAWQDVNADNETLSKIAGWLKKKNFLESLSTAMFFLIAGLYSRIKERIKNIFGQKYS